MSKQNAHRLDIHPAYREQLRRILKGCSHTSLPDAGEGLVLLQASSEGTTLLVLVDPATHMVRNAAYQGPDGEVQRGLLEDLCSIMEGRPILECSDHGVIWLEQRLRSHLQPPPVPGIVTPENADPAFELSTQLVRGLLEDYRRKTGYNEIENFYVEPASMNWRELPVPERLERIQAAIGSHPAGRGMRASRLEVGNQIVVEFDDHLDRDTKQSRLMQLESHLKDTIEPTVQLYMEPKMDQNKLRSIREVPAP